MDSLTHYRETLNRIFQAQADLMNSQPILGEEVTCVFDERNDHYLLLKYGWVRGRHTHFTKLHAYLRKGKIWIEEDLTESGLANELREAGVPPEDIVLGFAAPELRQQIEFEVA